MHLSCIKHNFKRVLIIYIINKLYNCIVTSLNSLTSLVHCPLLNLKRLTRCRGQKLPQQLFACLRRHKASNKNTTWRQRRGVIVVIDTFNKQTDPCLRAQMLQSCPLLKCVCLLKNRHKCGSCSAVYFLSNGFSH